MISDKIIINSAGTRVEKLARVHRFFAGPIGKFLSLIFWLFGLLVIFLWVSWVLSPEYFAATFGLDQILLSLFMIFIAVRSFLRFFVHNPEIISPQKAEEIIKSGKQFALFECLSVPLAEALIKVKNLEESGTSEVLKEIIQLSESDFIFLRLGIAKADILKQLESARSLSGVRFANIAERSLEIAVVEGHEQIEIGDMLVALSEADPTFSSILSKLEITPEDVANIVYWQTEVKRRIERRRKFLDPDNLHLSGGIGKDWAYGFTPELNKYSADISEAIERQGLHLEIIGHEKEVGLLEQALNRAEGANAVLVGEPGVGKRTTVLGLAEKLNSGNTLPNLAHKHVVELNVDLLISGLSGPGEFTQRITQVFSQAANAGNIIIYIEGMEKILSSGEAGQIDATPVLMPYLGYPDVNIIGTINISDYNNLIAPNAALSQKIEKIEVAEPTDDEMIRILEDIAPGIENHFRTIVTYGAIKETIKLAKKYVLDQPNPEKSISVLEGAANTLNKTADKVITAEIIDNYVSSKTNIPVKEATGNEREVLINLEAELHKRVVNQTEAVNKVAGALRRSRTGVTDSAKPIGSFLFLGPTGVGKTETAKSLAAVYFGQEDAMIRFDMSEYQNKEDVYRLIGSPAGYGEKIEGELTSQVRNRPFSLILFDEIEKANPDILNLFLQILDEGFITSSAGRKVYFKNSIIIATSNAGANLIRQLVEKNTSYEQAQKQVIDFVQNEGIFKPELINRFTSVVYYTPLSKEHIKEVAKLMIRKLATDIATTKGVKLKVEIKALAKLSEMGYDPEMGARPMARVIQDQIENFLANKILRGEAKKGDEVIFRAVDIK